MRPFPFRPWLGLLEPMHGLARVRLMRRRSMVLGVVGLVFAASTWAVDPRLELFQGLSDAQRAALLEEFGGNGSGANRPLSFPDVVQRDSEADADLQEVEDVDAPPRFAPGDSLLLSVSETRPADADPEVVADRGRVPAQGPARLLLGEQVLELSDSGTLELPGFEPVVLAGLTEAQAARRLRAEPGLAGLYIGIEILPVAPTGAEALEPFGYGLFAGAPTTFAPATDIPVPVDYVIGPGDTILLQLYGNENRLDELVVGRDGQIMVPDIGPKTVAGLSFAALREELSRWIGEQMIGVQTSVTLGELRSIRVFVVGDAANPGPYTVSSLSTLTHALFVAGGVAKNGSLRSIELRRQGALVTRFDLYDLLLRGNSAQDVRLQPGDVVLVPPVGPTVAVSGEVRRPAIYELGAEENLQGVLALAGGLQARADTSAIQLRRIAGPRPQLQTLDWAAAAGLSPQDGDAVHVPAGYPLKDGYVVLRGHVERPIQRGWWPGMRLVDLVKDPAILRPGADMGYVLVQRYHPPNDRIEVLAARLDQALTAPASKHNIALQSRDEVLVFGNESDRPSLVAPLVERLREQATQAAPQPVVQVSGPVRYPGFYPLATGMDVAGLIRAAGGLAESAFPAAAELIHYEVAGGERREVQRDEVDLRSQLTGGIAPVLLRPFDVLAVKQVPDWGEQGTVQVSGELVFPGTYAVKEGETLSQLVERAGGLTDQAFPQGAVFLRVALKAREQAQIDRLRDQLRTDLAAAALEGAQQIDASPESFAMLQSLLQQLETLEAAGRLVIDLPAVLAGHATDVVLKPGDRLVVPDQPQSVTVVGEVNHPTSHLFDANLEQGDYIDHSGGFTYKADQSRVYVVKANGQVETQGGSRWFATTPVIEAGDTVVVPLDVDRMRPITLWANVTQIMYQLGLTVAAFNAVGAF